MENKRKEQLPEEVKAAKQQPLQFQLQGSDGTERSYALEDVLKLAQQALQAQDDPLQDVPQLKALMDAYPDLTALPQEVEEGIKAGSTPLDAYRAYENAQLKQKLAAMQQQEKNRAVPGAQGGDAEEAQLDALMAIFNSVFQ